MTLCTTYLYLCGICLSQDDVQRPGMHTNDFHCWSCWLLWHPTHHVLCVLYLCYRWCSPYHVLYLTVLLTFNLYLCVFVSCYVACLCPHFLAYTYMHACAHSLPVISYMPVCALLIAHGSFFFSPPACLFSRLMPHSHQYSDEMHILTHTHYAHQWNLLLLQL